MKSFNVHVAKAHLSRLLDLAHSGEEVIITKTGRPCPALSANRMLAAQSLLEHLPLVTRDPAFQSFDIQVLW